MWFEHNTPEDGFLQLEVAQNADGRLELFGLEWAGRLFHRWVEGDGWSDWQRMGTPPFHSIVVGRNLDGRLELFGVTDSGTVSHLWQV
jgi:hypothetical protein